jgi:hypothetical protein
VPLGEPQPPRDELSDVFAEWVERRAVRLYGTGAASRNKAKDPVFSDERRKLLARWVRKGYSAEKLRWAFRGLVADNALVNGRTPKWQDVRSFTWMLEDQDQLDAYVEHGAAAAEREREARERRAAANGAGTHEAPSGVVAVAAAAPDAAPKAGGAA